MSRCRPYLPRAQPQRLTAFALSLAGHTLLYLLCCLPVQDFSTLRASEEEAHRSLSFLPPSLSHVVSRAFARCMLGQGASSRPWCFLIVTTSFTLSFRSNFFARESSARPGVPLAYPFVVVPETLPSSPAPLRQILKGHTMLRAATSLVLLLSVLSIIINLVRAQGYDFGVDVSRLTRRQTASQILVGKLPLAANGTIPVRQEIRQMRADKHKWDLFILSMSMFQNADQDDPLSYYQVTGLCHP